MAGHLTCFGPPPYMCVCTRTHKYLWETDVILFPIDFVNLHKYYTVFCINFYNLIFLYFIKKFFKIKQPLIINSP